MIELPAFTAEGLLPAGDYEFSLADLRASALVLGPAEPRECPTWDSSWRERLVENLAVLVKQLWQVGGDGQQTVLDGRFPFEPVRFRMVVQVKACPAR